MNPSETFHLLEEIYHKQKHTLTGYKQHGVARRDPPLYRQLKELTDNRLIKREGYRYSLTLKGLIQWSKYHEQRLIMRKVLNPKPTLTNIGKNNGTPKTYNQQQKTLCIPSKICNTPLHTKEP